MLGLAKMAWALACRKGGWPENHPVEENIWLAEGHRTGMTRSARWWYFQICDAVTAANRRGESLKL
jgi:hypothetical protein